MHPGNPAAAVRRAVMTTGVVAVVLLLTAACGSQDDDVTLAESPAPTPTPAATAGPTATPSLASSPTPDSEGAATPEYPFEEDMGEVVVEGAEQQDIAVLDEVRVARHEGFDRVVWEFSTGDRPTVRVRYDDEPRQPGSGEPVDVSGETALHMTAQSATDLGAELYAPSAQPYDGPERVEGANTATVTEAVALGDFEANMEWAVGVDERQPFRARVLREPLRIVVDVGH